MFSGKICFQEWCQKGTIRWEQEKSHFSVTIENGFFCIKTYLNQMQISSNKGFCSFTITLGSNHENSDV